MRTTLSAASASARAWARGTMQGIVGVFLGGTLGACSLAPSFERSVPPLPEQFTASAVVDSQTLAPWSELINDPQLVSLIQAGLEHNRTIAARLAVIEQARAGYQFSRSNRLPNLSITASTERRDEAEVLSPAANNPFDLYSSAGDLTFEIDLFGRLRSRAAADRESLAASEFGYYAATLTLISDIANRYFELLSADGQLMVANQTVQNRINATMLIRQKFNQGVVSQLDLDQALIEEAEALVRQATAERTRDVALHALSVLIGSADITLSSRGPLREEVLPRELPTGVPAMLLERRPDLRELEALHRAAVQEIGVARAGQYPELSLRGVLGLSTTNSSELFSSDARTWSVRGGLLAPLIDFGRSGARVEQALATAEELRNRYEHAVLVAVREVRDALSQRRTFLAELRARERQRAAAQSASMLSRRRYEDGISPYLEVLDSERSLFTAELSVYTTMQQYLSATVTLYKALGGGWDPVQALPSDTPPTAHLTQSAP